LTASYWEIGRRIVKFEQKSKGKKSETMSRILTSEEVSIQNEDLNTKVSA